MAKKQKEEKINLPTIDIGVPTIDIGALEESSLGANSFKLSHVVGLGEAPKGEKVQRVGMPQAKKVKSGKKTASKITVPLDNSGKTRPTIHEQKRATQVTSIRRRRPKLKKKEFKPQPLVVSPIRRFVTNKVNASKDKTNRGVSNENPTPKNPSKSR